LIWAGGKNAAGGEVRLPLANGGKVFLGHRLIIGGACRNNSQLFLRLIS